MKDIKKLLGLLKLHTFKLCVVSFFNILATIFSLFSVTFLAPFLSLIFNQVDANMEKPVLVFSSDSLLSMVKYYLSILVASHGVVVALIIMLLIVFLMFFLCKLFSYLAICVYVPVRTSIIEDYRNKAYKKILNLPFSYLSTHKKGDIISLVINDVQEIDNSLLDPLQSLLNYPLMIVMYLLALFFTSTHLTIFVLVLLPLSGLAISGIQRKLKSKSAQAKSYQAEMTGVTEEGIYALRVIKAFNAIGFMNNYFRRINDQYTKTYIKVSRKRDLSSPFGEFMGMVIVVCILLFGSVMVLSTKGLSPELFVAYIAMFTQIINPVKSVADATANLKKGYASVDRIETLLNETEQCQTGIAIEKDSFEKEILFTDVSFSYGEKPVLQGVNICIPKGKKIAICGMSGAGKTTIVSLLLRFYDVSSGKITIDGVDINDIQIGSLLSLFGVVSQESILFNDSIYNNILLGQKNVSEQDVYKAAQVAGAELFIKEFEDAYQTNVGDRGAKLSGGQQQRISIARALLKNPPILILDEATSALDVQTERMVQTSIDHLADGKTCIIIAHRLSTIVNADEIYVLEGGKVVEKGSHKDLINKGGVYKQMVDMQSFE